MSSMFSDETNPGWRYFGKRYLELSDFIPLCTSVGLHHVSERELEEMECNSFLFPSARVVMPKEYVKNIHHHFLDPSYELEIPEEVRPFHEFDWSLRYPSPNILTSDISQNKLIHPIDQNFGTLDQIQRPIREKFVPWSENLIRIQREKRFSSYPTAINYYHYWQIYELFEVRKKKYNFYKDNCSLESLGGPDFERKDSLLFLLDVISYFHHLYDGYKNTFFHPLQPNADGKIILGEKQQEQLQSAGCRFAEATINNYDIEESILIEGCKRLMSLHTDYGRSERIGLAGALKRDIWRAVELFHFVSDKTTEEISTILGPAGGFIGNYLELLFPNRREKVSKRSRIIIASLIKDHNKNTIRYSISDKDISDLFQFIESTDLAWFQYIVNEINEDYFNQNSWSTASSLLNLQSIASFPESMMKTIINRSGDTKTKTDLQNWRYPGLSNVIDLTFCQIKPPILNHYKNANHCGAKDLAEFSINLSHLLGLLSSASKDEMFIGVNLALTNLVRNYTSHNVIENHEIIEGHYIQSVKAIITTIFVAFKISQKKGWV